MRLTVTLPDELADRVRAAASVDETPLNDFLFGLIARALDIVESDQVEAEAFRLGPTATADDVRGILGPPRQLDHRAAGIETSSMRDVVDEVEQRRRGRP